MTELKIDLSKIQKNINSKDLNIQIETILSLKKLISGFFILFTNTKIHKH
jgi:hypothetical protein